MEQTVLYCGIDVSKGRVEAAMMDGKESRLGKSCLFVDTPTGHQRLVRWLRAWVERTGARSLQVGLEPTGGYEVHWVRSLRQQSWPISVRIRQLPTTTVSGYHKAAGQRSQTDTTSAWTLAQSLQSFSKLEVPVLNGRQRALRKWIRRTEKLQKRMQATQNELQQTLYETMPFVVPFMKDSPQWVLRLLSRYPTASKLARSRCAERIPHAPKEKVRSLRQLAAEQQIQLPADAISAHNVQQLAEDLLHMNRRLERECRAIGEQAMEGVAEPILQRLLSVPQLGAYSAAVLYCELWMGGRHYPSPDALIKAAGMDLVQHESGDRQGVLHLSKRGPSCVRRILYLAAWRVSQKVPVFRQYYQRQLIRNGGLGNAALVAVMRKLLGVLWKLVTDEVDFDGEYEARWKAHHQQLQPQPPQLQPQLQQALQIEPEQLASAPLSQRFRKKVKAVAGRKRVNHPAPSVTAPPSPACDTSVCQDLLYPNQTDRAMIDTNNHNGYTKKPT